MSSKSRLLFYIKKHPIYVVLSLICALIFVVSMVSMPLVTGKMVDVIKDMVVSSSVDEHLNSLFFLIKIASLLIVLTVLFEFIFEYIVGLFVERITKDLKDDLFIKLNEVSIRFIDNHAHGDLVNRSIVDTENVNNALISGFKQLYQGTIQIITTLTIMFIFNWILGLIVVLLTPLNFIVAYVFTKSSKKSVRATAKEQGELTSIVVEDFENLDIIKSFSLEDESFEAYAKQNAILYKYGQKSQFMTSMTNPLTRLINYFTYSLVGMIAAILCAYSSNSDYVVLGASCTIGTILTFVQYSTQFAKPFNEISSCLTEIQIGTASMRRINDILNEEKDIDEGKIVNKKLVDEISFEKVCFSYEPTQKLIENFNLKVKKGQKIAIVGPTGCGKTTMINLLLRFYDVTNGSINVNRTNINDLTKECLRNKFGMVLQDTWIFEGTVLENIKYAKQDASMEEVIEASKKANAYNFVKHLPKGFDTKISDKSGLSVGEKQLICIARVILADPEIMILDEATSNIDTRSELKIANAFNDMMKDKTSFIIAHRLSTIKNSDLIIVMKDGRIIETGNHKELLEKNGFYSRLYAAQYSN